MCSPKAVTGSRDVRVLVQSLYIILAKCNGHVIGDHYWVVFFVEKDGGSMFPLSGFGYMVEAL